MGPVSHIRLVLLAALAIVFAGTGLASGSHRAAPSPAPSIYTADALATTGASDMPVAGDRFSLSSGATQPVEIPTVLSNGDPLCAGWSFPWTPPAPLLHAAPGNSQRPSFRRFLLPFETGPPVT